MYRTRAVRPVSRTHLLGGLAVLFLTGVLLLAVALLVALPKVEAQGPPVFTGNVGADFNFTDRFLVRGIDPANDVGVPPAFPAGTISGWDVQGLSFFYNVATDTLFVGIDCIGVCGDADGDGDPGNTSAALAANGGVDLANYGGTESLALLIDTDNDFVPGVGGDFEVVVGVSAVTDITAFNTYLFTGLPVNPAFGFGAQGGLPAAALFASPSAGQPDIEFSIPTFSTLPGFAFVPGAAFNFRVSFFHGSFNDSGIGEDFTPAQNDFLDVPLGSIDIEKFTEGLQADTPTGPTRAVPGAVTWTYTVTNTGNLALLAVTIVDNNGTPGNAADDVTVVAGETLAIGETKNFQQIGVAQLGQYANIATVTASVTAGREVVTDSDPSHYIGEEGPRGPEVPRINLEKATNGLDADSGPGPTLAVGGPVTWTYVVTNIGNSPLTAHRHRHHRRQRHAGRSR